MTCNIVSNNIVFFCKTTLSPILEKLHETAYDLAQKPLFFNNYLAKQKLSYEPKMIFFLIVDLANVSMFHDKKK